VAGREVVVPEERHLLLERTVRVHHPEQPPLPRVGDVRVRGKLSARGDAEISRLRDLLVDVVGDAVVVDEQVDRLGDRKISVVVQFVGTCAEAGAAEQMFDLRVYASGHGGANPVSTTKSYSDFTAALNHFARAAAKPNSSRGARARIPRRTFRYVFRPIA